jgi:hypothetical protein
LSCSGKQLVKKLMTVARAIALFKVGWHKLASSAGPSSEIVEKLWWAGAANNV